MKKEIISFNEIPEAIAALMQMSSQILSATAQNHVVAPLPPKEILTIKDVCELLGINRTTLWAWEKKGTIKSYGIEGRKFFKRSEILESLIPLN
ncbi:helix-turn-helix domain-containing protein [Chryseobacterium sp. HSC-36S06]|uniref:helix-turn-helix domain-containing protein n=1 Tax=Chryseobacterium sp. HSC-36S06 TaxID=2910970 RepID=UPI0020A0ACDA|nr:helix-turn-helix domain-containing protein [Chryseobacterium sp. HSC-36S06]MCP2036965.1 excisionase family DNA binding protein [Chryseobacterium sp. HSC-36S06]